MGRLRAPKTRVDLVTSLVAYALLFAAPAAAMLVVVPGHGAQPCVPRALGPLWVALTAVWIGASALAIRSYRRWRRGIHPALGGRLAAPQARAFAPAVPTDLPPELLPSRRELPGWARPRGWDVAIYGAVGLIYVVAGVYAQRFTFVLVIAAIALALAAVSIAFHRARRRLLTQGRPAVATVTDVCVDRHALAISYEFTTAAGRRTGTTRVRRGDVVPRYGSWPEVGDPAYVVYDLGSRLESTLWSLPARRPRSAPGTDLAAVKRAVLATIGVVLFIAVWATCTPQR